MHKVQLVYTRALALGEKIAFTGYSDSNNLVFTRS